MAYQLRICILAYEKFGQPRGQPNFWGHDPLCPRTHATAGLAYLSRIKNLSPY